ncbi:hypothetical protein BH24ACT3_BH24ACT3_01840 [soil metagenome]
MQPRRRPFVRRLLLVLPVVVLAERAWARRWIADDGFINLRVVQQITAGNGPVFNAGERVEVWTSTLWVAMLTLADVVAPVRLEWLAVLLGIALTLAGLGLAMLGSRMLLAGLGPEGAGEDGAEEITVPVGALVLAAVPTMWLFASRGLEGGLVTAWLGACLWLLARWAQAPGHLPRWVAVVLGLGPLIRPELGLFTVAFLAVVLGSGWSEDRRRYRLRTLGCALALPVAYQVFRMGYYGILVPNPAIAKEASSSRWATGFAYLTAFVTPYALWLPLGLLAVGAYLPLVAGLRRRKRSRELLVVAAFAGGGLLQALYIVRVGGDWIHGRLLLPSLVALIAPVAVVPLRRRWGPALLVLPWAVVALLFLRSDVDRGTVANLNLVTVEDHGWGADGPARLALVRGDGVYYHDRKLAAEPSDGRDVAYASYGIGVHGYAVGPDVYLLDVLGLADPFTAHLGTDRRALPGHEKPLPAPWIVARLTAPGAEVDEDDFPFPVVLSSPLGNPDAAPFDERVATARATLRCSAVRDLFATYQDPLTPGRFFENLFGAPGTTALRIPPEPADTAAELCPNG